MKITVGRVEGKVFVDAQVAHALLAAAVTANVADLEQLEQGLHLAQGDAGARVGAHEAGANDRVAAVGEAVGAGLELEEGDVGRAV